MISAVLPPFTGSQDWDNALEKSEAAVLCIASAASLIDDWLMENAKKCVLSAKVLARLHELLFRDVFPQFAGRIRNLGFPAKVSFGDCNGVSYLCMDEELRIYEKTVQDLINQLANYQSASKEDYRVQVVRAAAWSHADFVRIHPFRDGNGRTGRLIIDYFAYRYDLTPLGIGRPKTTDYVAAMSSFMKHKDSAQLRRFLLPLMTASTD